MTPCVEWTGAKANGYGQRWVNGKAQYVHRLAWEEAHGPIPEGMRVLHRCDNPPCYRLDHLFLGTSKVNTEDMIAKGRQANQRKTHCPKGHPYDQTVTLRSGPLAGAVRRRCSICKNEARRKG